MEMLNLKIFKYVFLVFIFVVSFGSLGGCVIVEGVGKDI